MSRFQIQGDYQLYYKRGGKLPEIMAEAEWVIIAKKATHMVIEGSRIVSEISRRGP